MNVPNTKFSRKTMKHLNHNASTLSDQGSFTPVGAQGGVPWNPPKKTTFPFSHFKFCNEICTVYVCTIKNQNSAKEIKKKKIKMLYRFKMAAK